MQKIEEKKMITENKKSESCEDSPNNYCHVSDTRELVGISSKGILFASGFICKNCREHKQVDPFKVHDCKVLIYDTTKDGKVIALGQCNCYSKEHGLRENPL